MDELPTCPEKSGGASQKDTSKSNLEDGWLWQGTNSWLVPKSWITKSQESDATKVGRAEVIEIVTHPAKSYVAVLPRKENLLKNF